MADTRNFMWDNLSGSKAREEGKNRTFTTGEAEGLGTKKVESTDRLPTEYEQTNTKSNQCLKEILQSDIE